MWDAKISEKTEQMLKVTYSPFVWDCLTYIAQVMQKPRELSVSVRDTPTEDGGDDG
jgi:hypothetical protein